MSTFHDDSIGSDGQARARPVILQVLPSLETGGAERGCVDMAAAIAEAGGTALVASSGGAMVDELERRGGRHIGLPLASKNPLTIRRNIGRIDFLMEDRGVDLVHARSRAPAWSAYFACRRRGVPFVTTFHAVYNYRSAAKKRYNSVMARGERVIAISQYVARHARDVYGIAPERLQVIPRGIDLARFHPDAVSADRIAALRSRWEIPDGARIVLMPGRLTRWKGQGVLIDALAQLTGQDGGTAPVYGVIVGSDQGRSAYRRELEAQVERAGLSRSVILADHCGDMPAAYALCDVAVHASIEPEGFGRVIVEAQALGRPVIATNIGAPPETVLPEETGWLVPPEDPAALARILGRALALDARARHEMSQRAIAHVAAHYGLSRMTAATLGVYKEVLAP